MRVKHSKFKDCERVVKVEICNKTLVLVRDPYPSYTDVKPDYYVYWMNSGDNIENSGRTLLRTPSGRKISQSRAFKIMNQMINASKQLTFIKI